MRRILAVFGILLAVLVVAAAGAFAYASMQTKARLARTWPDVKGTEVPVPWPLTDAEVAAIREAKQAEAPPPAEGATAEAPDPLAGADLTAIAMERAIERGEYLMTVRLGCAECHGHDLAGSLVADAQPVWTWYCPNITRGGLTKDFKSADWDRAIRHGVLPDGRSSTMPAGDYVALSDRELSDIIAYA